jgi:hypothetical protein
MTRVYLPTSVARLREILAAGQVPVQGALAVDDARRRELPTWSEDDLEYLVLQDAALQAAHLLVADPDAVPVRAVIAVDVPDRLGTAGTEASDAAPTVPWRAVASVHLDGADAQSAVLAAMRALRDGGPATAELDGLLDLDLAWYAPNEIPFVLDDLDPGSALRED